MELNDDAAANLLLCKWSFLNSHEFRPYVQSKWHKVLSG